ncbi:slr1658 superfamily regulator [Synechocystis sp. CACIAM 05]|uniref:slr1658 superfamily regulator n=1 Tax=Synechocystis sp. CACIAM 05 TaxID=1933929 RepID=UPI00138E7FB6|nr:hypothetical protein [Synechocystis sp. CACIAM 05]QHV01474.1 hypothetical protein BWK47_15930 [Synechocystis sp. CACIAM 05]
MSTDQTNVRQWGEFLDPIPPSDEFLTLNFSLDRVNRLQRWRNYGLSADFLGDYFATFFPGNGADDGLSQRDTIKGSVSYIANELLENAVKYSTTDHDCPITITLHLYDHKLIFETSNISPLPTTIDYENFVKVLLEADPLELYMERLEKSALEDCEASQIGLLTMINDYQAQFGWRFVPVSGSEDLIKVTVMTHLGVEI